MTDVRMSPGGNHLNGYEEHSAANHGSALPQFRLGMTNAGQFGVDRREDATSSCATSLRANWQPRFPRSFRLLAVFLTVIWPTVLVPLNAWSQHGALHRGERTKDEAAEAARLVKQLDADSFAQRERATAGLIRLGILGEPELREALRSTSREVRLRSRTILAVILDIDFANRLEAFGADDDADGVEYGFPSWTRYCEVVGVSDAAKALFIEMVQAERELMQADGSRPGGVAAAFDRRIQEFGRFNEMHEVQHPLPRIAALLLVASDQRVAMNQMSLDTVFELTQLPACYHTMTGGLNPTHRDQLQKLLGGWLLRDDNLPAFRLLRMALLYNVPAAVERARGVLAIQPGDMLDRYLAILTLAKFGGKEDLPRLEEVLDDATFCNRYQSNDGVYEVQMRDLALAALIHLSGKQPSEFAYSRVVAGDLYVFQDETLGFASGEDREAAIAKWRAFRAEER